jgi:hypothetical protein
VALVLSTAAPLAAAEPAAVEEEIVAGFEGKGQLPLRAFNGRPPSFKRCTDKPKSGKACLRLRYTGGAGYGNLSMPVWLSGGETLVRFWLRCESAEPKAAMHIWFFERDGDGWLSPSIKLAGRGKGWELVEIPVEKFRHQPRGDGKKNLVSAETLLVGCNYGNFTACIDDLRFAGPGLKARRKEAGKRFSPRYTIRNSKPIADWWATLAAQYDPIQFMRESTSPNEGRRGMNESWWTVERERVRKMGLHGMRLWFQVGWWEPLNDNADPGSYKQDFSGFEVDGPRMKSVYRFFEMCRDYDVAVQLNFGWKFRYPIRYWMMRKPTGAPNIKDPAEHAESLVALLKYVRDVKKLKVISHISLGNEFEYNYPDMYPAMHARLVKEGLRDQYVLVGLEDNRRPLHKSTIDCAARNPRMIDVLSLHRYGTVDFGHWVRTFEADLAKRKIKGFAPSHFGDRCRTFFTEFPLGEGRGGGKGWFIADTVASSALAGAYGIGGWRLSDQHLPSCGSGAHGRDNFNHGLHEWGTWRWIPWMQRPRNAYYAASLLTRYTRRRSKVLAPINALGRPLRVVCFRKGEHCTVVAVNGHGAARPVQIRFETPVKGTFRRHLFSKGSLPKGAYDTIIPGEKSYAGGSIDDVLPAESFAVYTTFPEWPQAEVSPYVSVAKPGGTIAFRVKPIAYQGGFKWSVDGGAKNGTITAGGVYTAPKDLPAIDPVIVRATGLEDDRAVGLAVVGFSGKPASRPSRPALLVDPGTPGRKGRRQFDLGHDLRVGEKKSLSFKLVNHGEKAAPFTIDASKPWIRVSPAKGSVPPGGKESVAFKVTVDTKGLEAARWYLGYVSIRSPRGLGRDAIDVFFKTARK